MVDWALKINYLSSLIVVVVVLLLSSYSSSSYRYGLLDLKQSINQFFYFFFSLFFIVFLFSRERCMCLVGRAGPVKKKKKKKRRHSDGSSTITLTQGIISGVDCGSN